MIHPHFGGSMYIFSFLFMIACGEKETDTAGGTTEDTAVAQPDPGQPESSPDTATEPDEPQPSNEPEEPQPSSEPQGDAANGESIVNTRCMGCHGGNPSIENAGSMTDDELRNLFANGKGGMPPQNLNDQEVLDVIAYLRETYGGGQ